MWPKFRPFRLHYCLPLYAISSSSSSWCIPSSSISSSPPPFPSVPFMSGRCGEEPNNLCAFACTAKWLQRKFTNFVRKIYLNPLKKQFVRLRLYVQWSCWDGNLLRGPGKIPLCENDYAKICLNPAVNKTFLIKIWKTFIFVERENHFPENLLPKGEKLGLGSSLKFLNHFCRRITIV